MLNLSVFNKFIGTYNEVILYKTKIIVTIKSLNRLTYITNQYLICHTKLFEVSF